MTAHRKITIDDIVRTVATYYGLECEDIMAKSIRQTLIRPRHVAMYLARALARQSLPEIGRSFDRDHTSVLHAVRKIEALLQSDEELKAEVEFLRKQLSSRVQLRRVA